MKYARNHATTTFGLAAEEGVNGGVSAVTAAKVLAPGTEFGLLILVCDFDSDLVDLVLLVLFLPPTAAVRMEGSEFAPSSTFSSAMSGPDDSLGSSTILIGRRFRLCGHWQRFGIGDTS